MCTQLRVDIATQQLQRRTWNPASMSTLTAFKQISPGITNGAAAAGSADQPFVLPTTTVTADHQKLTVTLVSTAGPAVLGRDHPLLVHADRPQQHPPRAVAARSASRRAGHDPGPPATTAGAATRPARWRCTSRSRSMGLALGALLVPMLVSQIRTTRLDTTRVHAVDAAQAGIDVMVGRIRAANIDGVGTSTLLPCNPLSGAVNTASTAAYDVSIDYYMADPVAVPTAAKMRCVEGYGTYDPATDNFTPKYARITSTGTDGSTLPGSSRGRTLTTTYVFRTENTNIPGGRIRIYPASSTSPELCMDAGSAHPDRGHGDPAPGVRLTARRRSRSSPTAATSRSSCCRRSPAPTPTGCASTPQPPPTQGRSVVLGVCTALGSPVYTQQWSFNDSGGYTAVAEQLGDHRRAVPVLHERRQPERRRDRRPGQLRRRRLTVPSQAWVPSPAVGAGQAEAPQLINYYEFGRCLDVTGQNVNANHLIDYPCKQNPNPSSVLWNQKFTTPGIAAGATSGTGEIYTTLVGHPLLPDRPGHRRRLRRRVALLRHQHPPDLDGVRRQLGAAVLDQVHDRRQRRRAAWA